MMKRLITIITAVLILHPLDIVSATDPGTSAGSFLKIPASASSAGMGGGYSTIWADPDALSYNPAGISGLDSMAVNLNYLLWIDDTGYGNLNFVRPEVLGGSLGVGIGVLTVPDTERTLEDSAGNYAGTDGSFSAGYYRVAVSYAREINENIYGGASIKVIHEALDSYTGTAFALDIGAIKKNAFIDSLDAGLSVLNLGTKMRVHKEEFSLPLALKAGISYRPLEDLRTLLDFEYHSDSGLGVRVGAEYTLYEFFTLRSGFVYNENISSDVSKGIRAGFGINRFPYSFNYAYIPSIAFGATHNLSVGYSF